MKFALHIRHVFAPVAATAVWLAVAGSAAGQPPEGVAWYPVRPIGGGVNDLAIGSSGTGQLLYAAGRGVYRSGRADLWRRAERNEVFHQVTAGPRVAFAVSEAAAYRSQDNGRTWTTVRVRGPDPVLFAAISSNFATDGQVFAITVADWRLYRTDRGRSSYTELPVDPTREVQVAAVALSPHYGTDETLLVATDNGLYKSTNGGATFVHVPGAGAPAFGSEAGSGRYQGLLVTREYGDDPARHGDLLDPTLFAFNRGGAYRSDDEGASWTRLGLEATAIHDLDVSVGWPRDKTVMAAIADDQGHVAAVSYDGGSTWTKIPGQNGIRGMAIAMAADYAPGLKGMPPHAAWLPIAVRAANPGAPPPPPRPAGSREAYLATDGDGVWRTSDAGVTWTRANAGLTGVKTTALVMLPGGPDAVAVAGTEHAGLYRSPDGGRRWSAIAGPLPKGDGRVVNALELSPAAATDGTIAAATDSGIWLSRDKGRTWSLSHGQPATAVAFSPAFAQDRTLAAPGWISRDAGATWTPLAGTENALAIAFDPEYPGVPTLWVGSSGGLFKSTDGGESFTHVDHTTLRQRTVTSLLMVKVPQTVDPVRFFVGTDRGLLLTTNDGERFDRVTLISEAVHDLAVAYTTNPTGATVAAVTERGAAYSTNRGIDWIRNRGAPEPSYGLGLADAGRVILAGGEIAIGRLGLNSGRVHVPAGEKR